MFAKAETVYEHSRVSCKKDRIARKKLKAIDYCLNGLDVDVSKAGAGGGHRIELPDGSFRRNRSTAPCSKLADFGNDLFLVEVSWGLGELLVAWNEIRS